MGPITAGSALDGYGLGGLEWQPNKLQKAWLDANMPGILQANGIQGDYNDPNVRGQYYRQVALPHREAHGTWDGVIKMLPYVALAIAAPYAIPAIAGAGTGGAAAGTAAAETAAAGTTAAGVGGATGGALAGGAAGTATLAPVVVTGAAGGGGALAQAGAALAGGALAAGGGGGGGSSASAAPETAQPSPGAQEPAPPSNAPIAGTQPATSKVGGFLSQANDFIKSPIGQGLVNVGGSIIQGVGKGQAAQAEQDAINERTRYYDTQWRDPAQLQALRAAVAESPQAPRGYLERAQRVNDFMNQQRMQPGDPNKVYGDYVRGPQ
jgi:hypothetical protein